MPETIRDVACTFCGCVCDDLAVTVDAGRVVAATGTCALSEPWLRGQNAHHPPAALVDGVAGEPEAAFARAVELLRASRAPLIYGLSRSTTEGQRAATALADRLGATVDTTASTGHAPSIMALQQVGESTCTLGEVRNRADLVIFWGSDPLTRHPRHLERYSADPVGRFVPGGRRDRVVVVVDDRETDTAKVADLFIKVERGRHWEALWKLRMRVRGVGSPEPPNPPGPPSLGGKGGDAPTDLPDGGSTRTESREAAGINHPSPSGGGAGGGVATSAPGQAGTRADAPNPPGPPSLGGKGGDAPIDLPGGVSSSGVSQDAAGIEHPLPPRGRGPGGGVAAPVASDDTLWSDLAARMTACRFGIVFFGAGLTAEPLAHRTIEALLQLVADLNLHTRFYARRMRRFGDVAGADSVLTWQTGYPFGVNLARGYPRYNPGEFTGPELLARGEVDLCLVVGGDTIADLPPAARAHLERIPVILLDAPDAETSLRAAVRFTTAVYGVHRPGTAYRMDEVPIPLRVILPTDYPSDGEVLGELLKRVG